jgi:hypothetical protein
MVDDLARAIRNAEVTLDKNLREPIDNDDRSRNDGQ